MESIQANNSSIGDEIDAWAFGVEADLLADLVLKGEKTATASAYDLYAVDKEPLPQEGTFDIILDSQDQAICMSKLPRFLFSPSIKCLLTIPSRKVKETNLWPIGVRFMRRFSPSG